MAPSHRSVVWIPPSLGRATQIGAHVACEAFKNKVCTTFHCNTLPSARAPPQEQLHPPFLALSTTPAFHGLAAVRTSTSRTTAWTHRLASPCSYPSHDSGLVGALTHPWNAAGKMDGYLMPSSNLNAGYLGTFPTAGKAYKSAPGDPNDEQKLKITIDGVYHEVAEFTTSCKLYTDPLVRVHKAVVQTSLVLPPSPSAKSVTIEVYAECGSATPTNKPTLWATAEGAEPSSPRCELRPAPAGYAPGPLHATGPIPYFCTCTFFFTSFSPEDGVKIQVHSGTAIAETIARPTYYKQFATYDRTTSFLEVSSQLLPTACFRLLDVWQLSQSHRCQTAEIPDTQAHEHGNECCVQFCAWRCLVVLVRDCGGHSLGSTWHRPLPQDVCCAVCRFA
jgi:hypothetical protein